MKVCVFGLWHLGTVTAACLASAGHQVVGLDFDCEIVQRLQQGQPPISEPGLEDLIKQSIANRRLTFTDNINNAVKDAEIVWVTYDTPVNDEDQANVEYVVERVMRLYPYLPDGTLVLVSSQLPVGTTKRLEQAYLKLHPEVSSLDKQPITFGYSPENLRLGIAINVFTCPDRVVVGLRCEDDRQRVIALFQPFTDCIEWMSVESAEMTKHAINAFLATSIVFINELAILCEQSGADAKEVERGLKSDMRIGSRAYLSPGIAFAGGTLARDVTFLQKLGCINQQPTNLFSAVQESNNAHKQWISRKLLAIFGKLKGKRIAIWGLTYKPGTDTLRRSASIELCLWMINQGVYVQAHDPAVRDLPEGLAQKIKLYTTPDTALENTDALIVATGWQDYKSLSADVIVSAMPTPLVIDPARFLMDTLGKDVRIQYVTIGKGI